jgi:hypothetical protein
MTPVRTGGIGPPLHAIVQGYRVRGRREDDRTGNQKLRRSGERPTTSSVIAIWSARSAQDDATKSDDNVPSGLSGISLSYWTSHCQRTKLIADIAFYNQF